MKNRFLLVLLALFVFLPACKKKTPYRIPQYHSPSFEQPEEEKEEAPTEDGTIDLRDAFGIAAISEYRPKSLYIMQGTSLRDAFCDADPQMEYNSQKPYLGGPKLIAEMSADAYGINKSRLDEDCYINILPLHQLKLRICDDSFNIYALVYTNVVSIDMCRIESNGFFSSDFSVIIQLTNNTSQEVVVNIPKGQMIEAERDNVQNVVVKEDKQVVLQPYESKTIRVPALCAAHHRSDPDRSIGRITPYILDAPYNAYKSQQSVWNYIEEPAINRMVFYAWGRGPLDNGHESRTGHAFVFIPEVEYVGFSSAHGDWLDDEGVISNHRRQAQYAQDSCVVYITNTQLNNVHYMLEALMSNTPRYHIGYYDCTSFVMDIADAAGIYYGNRLFIQTPMGFIQELKKRN